MRRYKVFASEVHVKSISQVFVTVLIVIFRHSDQPGRFLERSFIYRHFVIAEVLTGNCHCEGYKYEKCAEEFMHGRVR